MKQRCRQIPRIHVVFLAEFAVFVLPGCAVLEKRCRFIPGRGRRRAPTHSAPRPRVLKKRCRLILAPVHLCHSAPWHRVLKKRCRLILAPVQLCLDILGHHRVCLVLLGQFLLGNGLVHSVLLIVSPRNVFPHLFYGPTLAAEHLNFFPHLIQGNLVGQGGVIFLPLALPAVGVERWALNDPAGLPEGLFDGQ